MKDWSPQRRALHLLLRRIRYREKHPKKERSKVDLEEAKKRRRKLSAARVRKLYWSNPEEARRKAREYWASGYGKKRNERRRNERAVRAMRERARGKLEERRKDSS